MNFVLKLIKLLDVTDWSVTWYSIMENTRDTIISSAFSFYSRPVFENISLSMIASRAGISKTAIYRHFKNKEDLENAMFQQILNEMYGVLSRIKSSSASFKRGDMSDVIVLLQTNNEYFNYILSLNSGSIVDNFLMHLKKKGVSELDMLFDNDGSVKDMEKYKNSIYYGGSILYFQLCRNKIYECKKIQDSFSSISSYAEKLTDFFKVGLKGDVSDCTLFRLAVLDEMCRKSLENMDETSRIFDSIAEIIREKGVKNITVESVAKGIGLAKSSMYSKFASKEQMIHSMIHAEIEKMLKIVSLNIKNAKSCEESIYIMMETELLYFMNNQNLFTVCRWLQFYTTEELAEQSKFEHEKLFSMYFTDINFYSEYPDLGLPVDDKKIVYGWIFFMPVFLYMHSNEHKLSPEIVQAMLKDIFYMMEKGAGRDKK